MEAEATGGRGNFWKYAGASVNARKEERGSAVGEDNCGSRGRIGVENKKEM